MLLVSRAAMRTGIVLVFLVAYVILIFYMINRMQQECLSAKDIARELNVIKLGKENAGLGESPRSEDSFKEENDESVPLGKNSYFTNDKLSVGDILIENAIPTTVYYVWCGSRWFEFPHYLSVMSVMKNIRPDNLVFLYDVYPVVDNWMYNTWFKELRERFPFIRTHQLTPSSGGCLSHSRPNVSFVKRLLADQGGMYINEAVIIINLPQNARRYDIIDAMDWKNETGFFMVKKGMLAGNQATESASISKKKVQCVRIDEYTSYAVRRTSCLYQTKTYYPKDIWNLETPFGRLARSIFYGTSKIKIPIPSNSTLVPNIAHVVWLGGGRMDFLFLLCVLSLLNVAKVESLYLHGDGPPSGPYWDLVKDDKRLRVIYRDYPGTIYGTEVKVLSHITDIWRVDFMVKYGGIYVDTDTVFVKPLDERIRSYDAVATYDWTYWNHPFPDTINFGVSIGKRNAKYWHLFQESMKWFEDSDWSWNGLRLPYKVMEKHPDLILIDPHLSVICFQSLCHPTWWPNYHNESIHHLNSKSISNWKEDSYAFHWTLPTPYELLNHTTLLTTKTIFSEIGTYVLRKSNLLEHFERMVTNLNKKLKR